MNTFCPSFCSPSAFGLMHFPLEVTKTPKNFTWAEGQARDSSGFLVSNTEAQDWRVPAVKPFSVLSTAVRWNLNCSWSALHVDMLKKKDAEIRKTLFHCRKNTFQLPSLLFNEKPFPADKELCEEIKTHTLEEILGFGVWVVWDMDVQDNIRLSVNQVVLPFIRFSDCKRSKVKPQLFQRRSWFSHITISCMIRNSQKIHLVLPWGKDVLCSVSGKAGATP